MWKCSVAISLTYILFISKNVEACDKTSCTPTPSHYEELGCTPIFDEEKCCPIRFTCPERQADAAGCQYRGKFYKVGEAITGQFLPKRCYEECICEQGQDEGTYKLSCRGIPTEDGEAYAAENILERKLDKQLDEEDHLPLERCYGIPITDIDEIVKKKKTKCTFEGVVYNKGERITPDGACYECICDERLKTQDLDLHTKQCQRKQCGIGSSGEEQDYLNRGCAPVYNKTATICCPIEWRCPTPEDVVKKSGLAASNMKCRFGDLTLGLLDHVTYEEGDNLNCKCYTPPMVHCLKGI